MAPEQAAGEPLSPASDWYAVGVMLFESLTGRLPFQGRLREVLSAKQAIAKPAAPISLDPSVPPDLNQLCIELLRRDPAERLSGAEILARLGEDDSGEIDDRGRSSGPLDPAGRTAGGAGIPGAHRSPRCWPARPPPWKSTAGRGRARPRWSSTSSRRWSARRDVVVLDRPLLRAGVHPLQGRGPVGRCADPLPGPAPTFRGPLPVARVRSGRWPGSSRSWAAWRLWRRPGRQAVDFPRSARASEPGVRRPRELLARLADDNPLVLCIDDIQWGDADSAALADRDPQAPRPAASLVAGLLPQRIPRNERLPQDLEGGAADGRPSNVQPRAECCASARGDGTRAGPPAAASSRARPGRTCRTDRAGVGRESLFRL